MNDAGQGQTAEGSWQPDPAGRYKLRWRRSTGEWTDHVYGDDGALGNDPYGPPSPPIPPPPPDEPPAMSAPKPAQEGPQEARHRAARNWGLVLRVGRRRLSR